MQVIKPVLAFIAVMALTGGDTYAQSYGVPNMAGSNLWNFNGPSIASGIDKTSTCGTQFGGSYYELGMCFQDTVGTHANNGQLAELFVVHNTPGSGTFGTAYADFALNVSETKTNYLTSSIEGEGDVIGCTIWWGANGDAGCGMFQTIKVFGTGHDTGGALGLGDVVVTGVNSSNVIQWEVHDIFPYREANAGASGGLGYGMQVEAWLGTPYAAYQVSTHNGYSGAYGFEFAFAAWTDRSSTNQYFSIAGDKIASVLGFAENPGDINIGLPAFALNFHTDGAGGLALRAGNQTNIYWAPNGGTQKHPVAIASLPTCNSAEAGTDFVISNGIASPTAYAAISTTGSSIARAFCFYNGTTYQWVY